MTETTTVTATAIATEAAPAAQANGQTNVKANGKANHKPKHEADIAEEAMIPKATGFVVSVFLGRGKYAKRDAATLGEARSEGSKLAGVHGKPTLVYAILPKGSPVQQVLVPATYQPTSTPTASAQSAQETEGAMRKHAAKGAKANKPAAKRADALKAKATASGERQGVMGGRAASQARQAAPIPGFLGAHAQKLPQENCGGAGAG